MNLKIMLVNLAATLFLTGLIWFVQVVHYPLFGKVGEAAFSDYARLHQSRTTWVVGPPMLLEACTSAWLVWMDPASAIAWIGLSLVFAIWVSTQFVQIPKHVALADGYRSQEHAHLVRWNWMRTAAWTVRSLLMLAMVNRAHF